MRTENVAGLAIALCLTQIQITAYAGSNDYVRTPTVVQGEREIDFKWGIQRNTDGSSESATSLGFGYGVNSWWFTEFYAKYKRQPGEANLFDAWELENKFQLTETGQYPVDIGFFLEVERPKDRTEGYEITYGPLFQSEWGKIQGNFNFALQKHVQATAQFDAVLNYQGQIKYRQSEQFEWGAQAFGSLGRWDHWSTSSNQEHKLGPAIFGKIKTGATQSVHWNAALLYGTTDSSPQTTLRFQAEYEF